MVTDKARNTQDKYRNRRKIRSKANSRDFFPVFLKNRSLKVGFSQVFGGPGGFRKVREVNRKNFLQVSSKSHGVVTSYDQKTKKLND